MRRIVSLAAAFVLLSSTGFAQSLGTFSWQLQPFCNVVSVTVVQQGSVYLLDGFDDQCGAAERAPLVGLATPNPDGTIGLGLNIVNMPGGQPVHVAARITLPSLDASWSDSSGNSGTAIFGGTASGLPARPAPTVPAAALAPNTVTTTTIIDGSVGAADINTTEVQRRVTTTCPRGTYFTGVSNAGTATCSGGGVVAALGSGAGGNTTAIRNTAVGNNALRDNVSGLDNTAVGSAALQSVTAPSGANTGIGSGALISLTTGFWNTALGDGAAASLVSGADNTALGRLSLRLNTAGSGNTALGSGALFNSTAGQNIGVGQNAGSNLTFGFRNIAIGNPGQAADDSTIRIGETQTRAFMAGVRGVTTATAAIPVLVGTDGQLGTVSSSRRFKEDIADMGELSARLFALRPVTFRYKQPAADGSKPLDFGLIAEEVAAAFPELAVMGADGQIETVAYHKLPVLLLNEVQKQQRVIEEQARAIEELRRRLDALTTDLKK